jgi:glycosyltransferase involved in cell wall biosynthesis
MMVTQQELLRDPRARRAARTARAAGIEVVELSPGDGAPAQARAFGGFGSRHPLVRELRGIWRLGRLTAITWKLVRRAHGQPSVDVVHANDFETLPAAWWIARRTHARLVYDSHEIYAAQEADPPRVHRVVAGFFERVLARRAEAVVTVNQPIARELEHRLRLGRPPLVVLNCPRVQEVPAHPSASRPLRAVYQSGSGPGRHVEDLLAAAALAEDVELTLRIAGADPDGLREAVRANGVSDRVHVVAPVQPDVLVESLTEFDVGLVITRPSTINDELGLPNKFFEYLMAGLAVVVPRLPVLGGLADGVGLTFTPGDPDSLADALTTLSHDRARLHAMRAEARRRAVGEYNAERQAPALMSAWGF